MSVSGEFRRILGDAVAVLRERPALDGPALADALAPLVECGGDDLSAAAEQVLERCAPLASGLAREPAADPKLREALDRLLAVSRIILGRG